MRNSMIKLVDAILILSIVIVILLAAFLGAQQGLLQAVLYAVGAFIVMSFINALWFCVSGIYHNTKVLADAARRRV